jgi:hypothetical protein
MTETVSTTIEERSKRLVAKVHDLPKNSVAVAYLCGKANHTNQNNG